MEQITLWGEPERIKEKAFPLVCRERLAVYGTSGIELSHIIGLLLDVPKETAVSLATMGIKDLLNCSDEELLKYKGVGKKALVRFKAVLAFHHKMLQEKALTTRKITKPQDVADCVMQDMQHLDREQFRVLLLNSKNVVLKQEIISIGTLTSSIVHPREVFKNAIKCSAACIILVHNHPSGDPQPSSEDVSVTKRLIEAGNLVGIDVLDHVIVGGTRWVSLKEKRLI
jgi:DNA repair protein RadC